MSRRDGLAAAFYEQARSDWRVHRQLPRMGLPKCHELHYLQMACEKLAKAYKLRNVASDVDEAMTGHVGFEHFINAFLRSPTMRDEFQGQLARHRNLCRDAKLLAREIEKLAPAVDRKQAPENAEYPWEREQTVLTPCTYDYPNLALLSAPGGRAFLKIIERAFRDYR